MRVTRIGYALGVAAAVAVFAGCSGNGSSLGSVAHTPTMNQSIINNHPMTLTPSKYLRAFPDGNYQATGHNWQSVKPNATTTYVIGCQFYSGFCNMYIQGHNTVVGQIFEPYVNGMCQDKLGNVYIPNGADTIDVYAHGSTTVSKTLTGDGNQPSACAVDSNGTVYVGDIIAAQIQVYVGGATTPTRFLSEPNAVSGLLGGIAVDESPSLHNLAASWEGVNGVGIDEYTHARQSGRHTVTTTTGLAGVAFDKNENLVETDDGLAEIVVFNGSVCNSFASAGPGGNAIFSALNKSNSKIVSGDFINSDVITKSYAFCTGGGATGKKYTGFTTGDDVEGVAMSPGSTD